MTNLKAKFSALREFVKTIPAEKLDMRTAEPINGGCGCVLFHLKGGDSALNAVAISLSWQDRDRLFDMDGMWKSTYPIPTGQPAKDEFLRRLDVLEAKYCGVES